MSNLIPKKIVDKRGFTTTRHVKADPKPLDSSLRNIAPVAATSPEGQAFGEALGMRMDAQYLYERGVKASVVMQTARRLPSETAAALNASLSKSTNASTFVNLAAYALQNGTDNDTLENIALFFNDFQYQEYDWSNSGSAAFDAITRDIRGVQQLEGFSGVSNFYRTDDDTKAAASVICKAFELAERGAQYEIKNGDDGTEYFAFKDARMVGLILDNMHQADYVLDLAYTHNADVEMMQNVLGTTASLRDGVL